MGGGDDVGLGALEPLPILKRRILFSTALFGRLFLSLSPSPCGRFAWPGRGGENRSLARPGQVFLLLRALAAAHDDQAQQDHGQKATNDAYDAAFHFLVPPTSKKGRY